MSTTSANFTVTNATPEDIGKLDSALSYLQGSQTAVDNLDSLSSQNAAINIIHNGKDGSYINPDTGQPTIDWDPDSGLTLTGGSYQSPALGLGHEVGHLVDPNGMSDTPDSNYQNAGDQATITGSEDPEAHDLGEPTRSDHGGMARPDTAPTDHTPTAADAPPVADSPSDGGGPYPGSIPADPPTVNPDPTDPNDPSYPGPSDPGDPGTGDPGTGDPGTGDPGTGDPGAGDPGAGDGGSGGGDGDGGDYGGGGGPGGDGGGGGGIDEPVMEEDRAAKTSSKHSAHAASPHVSSPHTPSHIDLAEHALHAAGHGVHVSQADAYATASQTADGQDATSVQVYQIDSVSNIDLHDVSYAHLLSAQIHDGHQSIFS